MSEIVQPCDLLPRRVAAVRLRSSDELPELPWPGPFAALVVAFDPDARGAHAERLWHELDAAGAHTIEACGPGADVWEQPGFLAELPFLRSPAGAIASFLGNIGAPFDVTCFAVLALDADDADWREVLAACRDVLATTVDHRLHHAAGRGERDDVTRAIRDGWPLDQTDHDLGWSPLHHAAKQRQLEAMRLLLAAGADVDARDEDRLGETALRLVVEDGDPEVVRVLLEAGANPHRRGSWNLSALEWSAQRRDARGKELHRMIEQFARRGRGGRSDA